MSLNTYSSKGHSGSLILLHGALGDAQSLMPVAQLLSGHWDVHVPDLPCHGKSSETNEALTIDTLVDFLDAYINTCTGHQPVVFGYSLGGYVALAHAQRFPGAIARIVTYGTKFHWSVREATRQVSMLDAEKIVQKVPAFAELLSARHGASYWRNVLLRTAHLMEALGRQPVVTPESVGGVAIPVDIFWGSEEKMVTQAESEGIAGHMADARFHLVPGLPHAIEQIPPQTVADLIKQSLSQEHHP